jgi:hypothetical protein
MIDNGNMRDTFNRRLVEVFADRLIERIECEDGLPLPTRTWDVVVDDPTLAARHEYRGLLATTARAAGVKAYEKAMRDEGFRCMAIHPPGDETTLAIAREGGLLWSVVHQHRKHPDIDYTKRPERVVREAAPAA